MTTVFDGPGTEQELDAIEELAEAMYRADRILIRHGTPPRWADINDRIRQQFRTLAEDWVEERAS